MTRSSELAGRRRGPPPRLSRDAILVAAAQVDPLSIGAVAARLDVSVGSLYRYVEGLDDLAVGAVARLFADAPMPSVDRGWRAFLEAEAALYVQLRREYPALFAVPAADRAVVVIERTDRAVRALVELGFDVDEALLVTDSVADLVRDAARQALAIENWSGALPTGFSPPVEAALRRVVADPWAFLDRKLELLFDGVEARSRRG